ncbi:hypothetical protein SDJN02_21879, partial [Cucurbita argyrosperma subsp. argyrosperma]
MWVSMLSEQLNPYLCLRLQVFPVTLSEYLHSRFHAFLSLCHRIMLHGILGGIMWLQAWRICAELLESGRGVCSSVPPPLCRPYCAVAASLALTSLN